MPGNTGLGRTYRKIEEENFTWQCQNFTDWFTLHAMKKILKTGKQFSRRSDEAHNLLDILPPAKCWEQKKVELCSK